MSVTLSDGFLTALNSDRFRRWNFFPPEQILSYWDFAVKIANMYEEEAGITPSQKRGGYLLEEMARIRFMNEKNKSYEDFFRGHLNGKVDILYG